MGTTITPVSIDQAIAAVGKAETDLANADVNQASAQSKFDAAKAAKTTADQADADAITAWNNALDVLIASATAAKKTPPAPPGSPA